MIVGCISGESRTLPGSTIQNPRFLTESGVLSFWSSLLEEGAGRASFDDTSGAPPLRRTVPHEEALRSLATAEGFFMFGPKLPG